MSSSNYYLFVPGYYGSSLVEAKSQKTVWGNPWEIFLGRATLALPTPGFEKFPWLDLKAHQVIERVRVVQPFFTVEAYGKIMDVLRGLVTRPSEQVFALAYDWRRDPMLAVSAIDEKIRQIQEMDPSAKISLIGHSFGALISSYYLRYGQQISKNPTETWEGLQKLQQVVLAAAPFRGTWALFRNMRNGLRTGINHRLQSSFAFSTLESSYYLLPPPGEDFLLDEQLKPKTTDLHNPENWWTRHWGLFQEGLRYRVINPNQVKNHFSELLSKVQDFHQAVQAPLKNKKPPIPLLYLQGIGTKTLAQGVWTQNQDDQNLCLFYRKDFKRWLPNQSHQVLLGDGDGTITTQSSRLLPSLEGAQTVVHQTTQEHLRLLQSPESQKLIRDFLSK